MVQTETELEIAFQSWLRREFKAFLPTEAMQAVYRRAFIGGIAADRRAVLDARCCHCLVDLVEGINCAGSNLCNKCAHQAWAEVANETPITTQVVCR